jgi:D-amino peptidase
VARERIRAGARRAIERVGELSPPAISLPARLDISFQNADMAEISTWARGIERTGLRSVVIEGDDPLAMFRSFVAMSYLTRQVEGR